MNVCTVLGCTGSDVTQEVISTRGMEEWNNQIWILFPVLCVGDNTVSLSATQQLNGSTHKYILQQKCISEQGLHTKDYIYIYIVQKE